jgi:hypothetical protein
MKQKLPSWRETSTLSSSPIRLRLGSLLTERVFSAIVFFFFFFSSWLCFCADVSKDIRTEAIAKSIGPVAKNAGVRSELVKRQQAMGRMGSVVMDGRDIGTVVFPDAELKVLTKTKQKMHFFKQIFE